MEEVTKMFPKLFSTVRIGGLEIKNRVAMTAMGVNLAAAGGGVNDDIIAFYEARARGGIRLIDPYLTRPAWRPLCPSRAPKRSKLQDRQIIPVYVHSLHR